jgi:nucleoside-diphosphate kinase
MGKITYAMIKPDGFKNSGHIIQMIKNAGFVIEEMKLAKLKKHEAERFYDHLKDKDFYNDLVNYMTSGKIIKLCLRKENAVEDFRNLIGATDPKEANPGTIRALYGTSIDANAIHGSDSDSNALKEVISMFGPSIDIPEVNSLYD